MSKVNGFKVFNIFEVASGIVSEITEDSGNKTSVFVIGNPGESILYDEYKLLDENSGCFGIALAKEDEGFFEVANLSQNFGKAKNEFNICSNDFVTTVKGLSSISYSSNVRMLVVQFEGFNGMNTNGEVPNFGNLGYINGAMNRLIVAPKRLGEPCLNALYINSPIDQTPHTHPSSRIGLIMDGCVIARIYQDAKNLGEFEDVTLEKGDVFVMSPDLMHSFHKTDEEKSWLVAFHPDSDFGPTDESGPMINRTIVGGISASKVKSIHTIQ
jgi:hypothetical protein